MTNNDKCEFYAMHVCMEQTYRKFTYEDVAIYGKLIGDLNPIHQRSSSWTKEKIVTAETVDANDEQKDPSSEVIVHGMLVSSLFSSIFGTLIPGSIYRTQHLKFLSPVYANDLVIGRVDVLRLRRVGGRISRKIDIEGDDDKRSGGGSNYNDTNWGVLCTCSTKVFKQRKKQSMDDCEGEELEKIECLTGEATVWLPGITTIQ